MAHITLSARLIQNPEANDNNTRVQLVAFDTTTPKNASAYYISFFGELMDQAMRYRKNQTLLITGRQTLTWDEEAKRQRLDFVADSVQAI